MFTGRLIGSVATALLAALVALTLGCVANETAETRADAGAVVNGPLGQALDAHLTAQEKIGLHGTALVAKRNDVLLHKGYGFANRQKRRRNTPETIFDIGSITKQFTATAIMKLESQGKLSTEDRLSKHFANVPPDKSAITLHHLLNHTSGFDDAYGEDTEIAPRDETVRLIMSKPLLSTPGIQYRYSNPGYSLLAAIVEVRSGQPWERYLAETFFKPAGMTKTGYRLPRWNLADMSHNYNEDVDNGAPYERSWGPEGPYWHLFGNGGILMTTGDMFRWVKALEGERALPDALKKKMWTKYVRTTSESEAYYATGGRSERPTEERPSYRTAAAHRSASRRPCTCSSTTTWW